MIRPLFLIEKILNLLKELRYLNKRKKKNHSSVFNIMIEVAVQVSGEINYSINVSKKIQNVIKNRFLQYTIQNNKSHGN